MCCVASWSHAACDHPPWPICRQRKSGASACSPRARPTPAALFPRERMGSPTHILLHFFKPPPHPPPHTHHHPAAAGEDDRERMGNALAQMAELQPMGTTLATANIETKVRPAAT